MKKLTKALFIGAAVAGLAVTSASAQNTVSCQGSILPSGICDFFAGLSGGFTFTGIIGTIFTLIIAALVVFILFQIIKAVFEWIGKSNDEKARGAAIKSITNAVIAGIVLIIALIVVVIGARVFGVSDIPALSYACYPDKTALTADGTAPSGATELGGVQAIEGKGTATNNTKAYDTKVTDKSLTNTLENEVYCKDKTTNKETVTTYVVAKRLNITK